MVDGRVRDRLFDALLGRPLVSNAFRGTLVEAIIAEALEPEWRWCADGWGSFDFEGPDGMRLEVKQSAARQGWHEDSSKPCLARFDIAERTGFWDDKSKWVDAPGRAAAIYIFAHHPVFDVAKADHRDPLQWDFYVVRASALPARKTIGLSGLLALPNIRRANFDSLLENVGECLAGIYPE
jgi:hypothetical protein